MKISKALAYLTRKISKACPCTQTQPSFINSPDPDTFVGCIPYSPAPNIAHGRRITTPTRLSLPVSEISFGTKSTISRTQVVAQQAPQLPYLAKCATGMSGNTQALSHSTSRSPRTKAEVPSDAGITTSASALIAEPQRLEPELQRLYHENDRLQEEMGNLQRDLDRQHRISDYLLSIKSSSRKKLMQENATLTLELQNQQRRFSLLDAEYRGPAALTQAVNELSSVKKDLANVVSLMEVFVDAWSQNVETTRRKEQQLDRFRKRNFSFYPVDAVNEMEIVAFRHV